MALQVNVQNTSIGIAMPDAYARISGFSGDKTSVRYTVETYANAQARQEKRVRPVKREQFSVPAVGLSGDILPALYADLKKRPGYENAIDV